MPHFITSAQPEDHITSANDAHLYAGLFGNGNYLLNVRELMAVTMIDSNTLRILGGDALTCGRHWEITGDYEEVSIDNGVPGFNRIDLVVAHIETAPQESISLRVIKGQETENTPTVPGYITGDLNDGDTVTEVPICSVRINGINPSEPVKLLTTILPTITDLINTDRLADALITNTKLADGSVSLAKIIDGAVGNTKLAANAVSEDKIQNGVVSANKLASNSVNAAKIVDGSVGTAELASSAVTTAKIADKNVTLAKLDQSLQNSISHAWTRLWTGTLAKGASVSIPNLNTYKFIGVKLAKDASSGTSQIMLIGVFANPAYGTGSTELHCDSQSDSGTNTVFWKASFNVTNTTLKLQSASIHEVITSSPYLKGTAQVIKEIWGFK